ncbi:VanW family protein [Candidatus Daviesbacteria bacterium]|nr:VanW family protein [Candidatus Daviesbacteria bacterium]
MKKKGHLLTVKYHRLQKFFIPFITFTILLTLLTFTLEIIFQDKFFPRVYIGDTHLFFLDKGAANQLINSKFQQRVSQPILGIDLSTASAKLDLAHSIEQAFITGHDGPWQQRLLDQLNTLLFTKVIIPQVDLAIDSQVDKIAKSLHKSSTNATLLINDLDSTTAAQIQVSPAELGQELDRESLTGDLKNYLIFGKIPSEVPTKVLKPPITTAKAQKAKAYLEELSKNPIKLTFQNLSWSLDAKTLITLLDYQDENLINKKMVAVFLQDLTAEINQEVVEAQFNFNPSTNRVTVFKPAQEGRNLQVDRAADLIILALTNQRAKIITLPVEIIEPKVKTAEVNNLGIKELIGRGISHFRGSIPNRVYNIQLAASRINGILIPPGEIFSFNDRVGDISAESGYKQAYVIKSGRTVLDDGGGVCQDSTTLFRAVLNAGLPVVQRVAHAYRVGYYEQGFPPGLDATVFAPSVDFKFKNDTSAHILIQAYTSGNSLFVDLYGTSDGRISKLTTPVVTNQIPPPPELRQDDPTLAKGEVKQVDFPAWGANVSFKRTVTRAGETIISETWNSNFKPWQAVYLVGTKE